MPGAAPITGVLRVPRHQAETAQLDRRVEGQRDLVSGLREKRQEECHGGRGHLRHEAPEEGLALVGAGDAVVLVVLDRALDGSRGVLVRHKQLNAPKLPILQLLHLPLEGGVGANVLEQAGLVGQPQLLLFLLALLMVLVELAHLRLDEVLQEPVH